MKRTKYLYLLILTALITCMWNTTCAQAKFNETKALNKLEINLVDTMNGTLMTITNNNTFPISLTIDFTYYLVETTKVGQTSNSIACIGKGKTASVMIYYVNDAGRTIKFDYYDIHYTITKSTDKASCKTTITPQLGIKILLPLQ